MSTAKQQAKEVVREMDRRRRKRTIILILIVIVLVALALGYLNFGKGLGFGPGGGLFPGKGEGKGDGKGEGTGDGKSAGASATVSGSAATSAEAAKPRCALRLSKAGITVDGQSMTQEQAIEACQKAGGADVLVTGDAKQGDWEALKKALDGAKVPTFVKDPATSSSASASATPSAAP